MHFPKFTFLKWTIILGFLFTIWKVGKEVDVQFHWVWNHFPVSCIRIWFLNISLNLLFTNMTVIYNSVSQLLILKFCTSQFYMHAIYKLHYCIHLIFNVIGYLLSQSEIINTIQNNCNYKLNYKQEVLSFKNLWLLCIILKFRSCICKYLCVCASARVQIYKYSTCLRTCTCIYIKTHTEAHVQMYTSTCTSLLSHVNWLHQQNLCLTHHIQIHQPKQDSCCTVVGILQPNPQLQVMHSPWLDYHQ